MTGHYPPTHEQRGSFSTGRSTGHVTPVKGQRDEIGAEPLRAAWMGWKVALISLAEVTHFLAPRSPKPPWVKNVLRFVIDLCEGSFFNHRSKPHH